MKNSAKHIAFIFITAVTFTAHAQLIVDVSQTPQQLVQNVLAGSGVTITNVTFNGYVDAIGSFTGTTSLGISSGIVMTTGTVLNTGNGPQGPNNIGSSGVDNLTLGDADLTSLIGVQTKNAAILEFDFKPAGDTIKFKYVFGSEEYPEYVCSDYTDVFAFLVDGPNPAGGNYVKKNIAQIPGTSLAVAINTVNPGSPGSIANGTCSGASESLSFSNYYVNNSGGASIQYDGYTKVLTAIAPVVCGATYHLKLAIADANDGVWDSGVFLQAGSLSANEFKVSPKTAYGINDSTMYEGCGRSKIAFTRNGNIAGSDTIHISIGGVATNGVDYTYSSANLLGGTKLFFSPGQDSAIIDFQSILDALVEPTETITLNLSYTLCNTTYAKTFTLFIQDVSPLIVNANNDTALRCPKQITLNAVTSGGVPANNYTYTWNTGQTTKSFTITPALSSTYIVTVTNTCNLTIDKDTVNITLNYVPLKLAALVNDTICKGASTTLTATALDGHPAYKYAWQPGGDTASTITVSPLTTTVYTINATDSCNVSVAKTVKVSVSSPRADFSYDFITNSEFAFLNGSSGDVNLWEWNFGDSSVSSFKDPTHAYADTGTFLVALIVTNSLGCKDTTYENVIVYPDFKLYFPNSFTPNGDGLNDTFGGIGEGVFSYKMQLYDRWGDLIFTSEEMNVQWDGRTKHGLAPEGVYVCVFTLSSSRKVNIKQRGSVVLIR